MSNIANILQTIQSQSDALLLARFPEPYRRAAEHDVRDFLQQVRPDLENWVRLLQNRDIDRTDFASLVSDRATIADMEALNASGLARLHVDSFLKELIEIIIKVVLSDTDSGGPS